MGTSLKQKPEQKQHSTIVEFVGLPGAGKTTLCGALASQLRQRGRSVVCRDEILKGWHQNHVGQKLAKLMPDRSQDWRVLRQGLAMAAQVQPWHTTSFLKAATMYVNAKRNDTIARSHPGQTLLLDQGVLQEAWSVAISRKHPPLNALKRAIEVLAVDRGMRVVAFEVDVQTAVDRIVNRATHSSRFDGMNVDLARETLSRSVCSLQAILESTQQLGVPILHVNSSSSIEENVAIVREWLLESKD